MDLTPRSLRTVHRSQSRSIRMQVARIKAWHQDGGSADDRRGRPTQLVRMRPIRVGRKLASVRRCHAIHHRSTAHAEESRIKIPCPIPSAVARRPVHHTVALPYVYSARCIVRRTPPVVVIVVIIAQRGAKMLAKGWRGRKKERRTRGGYEWFPKFLCNRGSLCSFPPARFSAQPARILCINNIPRWHVNRRRCNGMRTCPMAFHITLSPQTYFTNSHIFARPYLTPLE